MLNAQTVKNVIDQVVTGARTEREKAIALHDYVRDNVKFGFNKYFDATPPDVITSYSIHYTKLYDIPRRPGIYCCDLVSGWWSKASSRREMIFSFSHWGSAWNCRREAPRTGQPLCRRGVWSVRIGLRFKSPIRSETGSSRPMGIRSRSCQGMKVCGEAYLSVLAVSRGLRELCERCRTGPRS